MTTKATGSINYYPADGGQIIRTVTAADVEALEAERQQIAAALGIKTEARDLLTRDLLDIVQATVEHLDSLNAALEITIAERDALEQAYRAASAIMRSQPIGVPPRLVKAWREAVEKVENAAR